MCSRRDERAQPVGVASELTPAFAATGTTQIRFRATFPHPLMRCLMAHTNQIFTFWRAVSRRTLLSIGLALLLLAGTRTPAAAQQPTGFRVVPIVREDRVYVTFVLADGFTEDVRAAIQSGLKTTFIYDVELRLDVPGWVDRTIGTSTITANVEYNNLLRRYTLTRVVDGRQDAQDQVDSEAKVRQWMTSLKDLPLFKTSLLELNREYYIRVRATARPSNGSLLWPFGSGTSAMAKFTFIK
jgi:hypothetical protein